MKMGLTLCFFLSGALMICDGLRVLGPSGPLIVKPGGSVMLPCYVEAPIPLEELEVEWTRTDSETLVHLFQEGESLPESQDPAYSGRASFFTEEVQRGNCSLLLTNLTTKDAGVYRCSVYRQQETGQASMKLEYLIVTGGHAVFRYTREDVTLNCSVISSIPPEELEEVIWKKIDQDITVLVFLEGEVLTEFTHKRFTDRVEFFGLEEIHKGNFSLRLKDVRMEDTGLYRCEVHSGEFFANTTVDIQHLGFSHIQHVILLLCGFTSVCGSLLLLGCIPYTFCKGPGSCTVIMQHVLVFCPNILMFVAFILWGVLEGFIIEAATFSIINLLRPFWLLLFSPFVNHFQDKTQEHIKISPVLEWVALSITAAIVFGLHGWRTQNVLWMCIGGCALGSNVALIIGVSLVVFRHDNKCPDVCIFICFCSAIFIQGVTDVVALVIPYFTNEVLDTNGIKGLICLIVLRLCCVILVLTVIWCHDIYEHRVQSNYHQVSPALIRIPYTLGIALLFLVNSVTLAVDLIRQAGNGERTVEDLQLIFLPFEMIFIIVCSFAFWYYSSHHRVNQNSVL